MKRATWLRLLALAAALVACLLVGMRSGRHADFLYRSVAGSEAPFVRPGWTEPDGASFNEYQQLVAYPARRELPRPTISPRTIVAFAFGQSNSANHGGEKYRAASDDVLNFWQGRYFLAEDPLLGASGRAGSVWTLTANKLLAAQAADRVILLAAGVAATSVHQWAIGGPLNGMFERRLQEAKAAGLTVTHFLWHQGEADNSLPGVASYAGAMKQVIALSKSYFPASKFFVAQASRCSRLPPSPELRAVQASLADMPGVFAGPNTDEISLAERYDDCHFSGRGLEAHASGWAAAIAAHPN
jgi:hypothetical protein